MGQIKQAYIVELEQRLNDGQVELRKLQARLDKANLDTEHELYIQMQILRQQREETKTKLQALREVDHENWRHMKEELDNAWQHMAKLLHKMGAALEHQWDTKN
jgi:uncharacterized FlaG/YvyC family protein